MDIKLPYWGIIYIYHSDRDQWEEHDEKTIIPRGSDLENALWDAVRNSSHGHLQTKQKQKLGPDDGDMLG